jgi:hypothetical protein
LTALDEDDFRAIEPNGPCFQSYRDYVVRVSRLLKNQKD